jgi:ribosome-associated translation inhibitor RaiA
MTELDFTIEFNSSDLFSEELEHDLFLEADAQLRQLAEEQNDLRGAAINIRAAAQVDTNPLYEITIVVYARPNDIAATVKVHDPITGLKNALSAIERQVREKRDKLDKPWQRPANA